MPYRFTVLDVDEPNEIPSNSDFAEPFDEDEYEDDNDCFFCSGTGEGETPDTRCSFCKGKGYIKRKI
jgi:RecJ-like exonuclease